MWLVPWYSQFAHSLLSNSHCSMRHSQIWGRYIQEVAVDSKSYICLSWSYNLGGKCHMQTGEMLRQMDHSIF